MINTIIKAFISFIGSNIDDIIVLMLFFSQINNIFKKRYIIIGQYVGIVVLTAISILGALGMSLIPNEYVGLLGIVPIGLGIKEYVEYKKESRSSNKSELVDNQDEDNNKFEEVINTQEKPIIRFLESFINPSIIKVAAVTIANGGDNIGIYMPLFTSMNLLEMFITVVVFLLLTALWCFIGLRLARFSFIQTNIEKYKHILIPVVFIGLGIFILIESETLTFIYQKVF